MSNDSRPTNPNSLDHAMRQLFDGRIALDGPGAHYAYQIRLQVRRLEEFLGRPATCCDLNEKAIHAFADWLSKLGRSKQTVSNARSRLRALRRNLAGLGMVDDEPVARLRLAHIAQTREPLNHHGLLAYFRSVYLQEKLRGVDGLIVRRHELAIEAYQQYLAVKLAKKRGGYARLGSVNDSRLRSFRNWLVCVGFSDDVALRYRQRIRAIAKHACPARFKSEWEPPNKLPAHVPVSGSVLDFLTTVYEPQKLLGASQVTRDEYRCSVRRLNHFAQRDVLVNELTDAIVAGLLGHLLEKGASPATVNKHRRNLFAVWRFAHRRGAVDRLPTLDKLREPKRLVDAWTLEEFAQILASSKSMGGWVGNLPARHFWPALLLTAFDTGARIDALMKATPLQLHLGRGILRIPAEHQKHRTDQVFFLHSDTTAALSVIVAPEQEKIFPWPYEQNVRQWKALNRAYRGILLRAGLPHGRRDLFHKIRRTVATLIAARSNEHTASRFLGHSSVNITRAYIDATQVEPINAIELLPRPKLTSATSSIHN
ncbi:MAG: site-specific integrase [Pirellulales bacterium]|nr:site-specific integrase [Pirellulales bacterium]